MPATTSATSASAVPKIDTSTWHLHVKHLAVRIDFDKLLALTCGDDEIATRFAHASGWALDKSRYEPVLRACPHKRGANTPYTTLSSADVAIMLERGVIARIDPDHVQGHVILFRVPEPAKNRWRPIRYTKDINDVLGRETLASSIGMATKADIISLVRKGSHCISFDAAAFFDQFCLDPEIQRLMCFRKGRKWYRLVTSPMGQRQSVELAHSAMQKLAHHPDLECSTAVIIDNCIYVGSFDRCLRDAHRFLERCAHVGCTINEDTSDVASLIVTEQEWAGIAIDLTNKRTKLTSKMIGKLELSWSLRDFWTRRSFASHMGLLFWAVGIVIVNPGDFFPVLKFYANMCREASYIADAPESIQNAFWATPISFPSDVEADLTAWTAQVSKNVSKFVHPVKSGLPDWLVSVDACRTGFGYCALNPATGETRSHGQRWPTDFMLKQRHLLHRSVFTEPNGVIMSMCHLLTHTGERQRVHIWTDSVTTMTGGNRGFNSRSADVNDCLRRLRALFPSELYHFSFSHIAGSDNVAADAASRGRHVSFKDGEGAAAQMLASFGGEAADGA